MLATWRHHDPGFLTGGAFEVRYSLLQIEHLLPIGIDFADHRSFQASQSTFYSGKPISHFSPDGRILLRTAP